MARSADSWLLQTGFASGGPCRRVNGERAIAQYLLTPGTESSTCVVLEPSDIAPGRADTKLEWLPPLVEVTMLNAHRERSLLHAGKTRSPEQSTKVSSARPWQLRLARGVRVELDGSSP